MQQQRHQQPDTRYAVRFDICCDNPFTPTEYFYTSYLCELLKLGRANEVAQCEVAHRQLLKPAPRLRLDGGARNERFDENGGMQTETRAWSRYSYRDGVFGCVRCAHGGSEPG